MQAIIALVQKIIFNPRVMSFVIVYLTSVIRKKYMQPETENQIQTSQPLHLPRGSVRALITLCLTLVVAGSFVWHYQLPEEFLALSIFAIGYYVGYRTDNTQLPEID